MTKFFPKRRVLAILLALTIFSTIFSSLSMITPTATVTTEYNTKVVHIARGNATNKDTARYVYFNIANAEDIVAGDTYTVKMTYVGSPSMTTTANNRYLAIRQGEGGTGAQCLAICSNNVGSVTCDNYGTLKEENGATEWTVDVTPTAEKTLSACVYIGKSYTTADFYIGGVQVIDKNGNDIAIALSDETDFYNNASVTNPNWYGKTHAETPTTNYFETCEVITISEITDATAKQALKDALVPVIPTEENTKVVHIARGNATNKDTARYVYFNIANAEDIVAGDTYTVKMTYVGSPSMTTTNNDRYLAIRQGEKGSGAQCLAICSNNVGSVTCDNYGTLKEENGATEWTVDVTPTAEKTLSVCVFIGKSYTTADFYIGGVEVLDKDGEDIAIALSDETDFYNNASPTNVNWYNKTHASTPTTNYFETCEVITVSEVTDATAKQALKDALIPELPTEENTKVVHIARGNATNKDTARYVYFNIANAEDIVAGDTYTVKMTYVGSPSMTTTNNDRYLAIRQGEKGSGAQCLAICSNNVGSVTCDNYGTLKEENGATEWTVDVTPTAEKTLSVCVYIGKSYTTADFYIGGVEVLDKDGEDIAIALSDETDFYNNASPTNVNWYNKTHAETPTTNYFETCEVITISEVTDATAKQALKDALGVITVEKEEEEEPTADNTKVVHIARGNAELNTTARAIYFKIANAADIVANETYTVTMTYTGTTVTPTKSTRFIGIRESRTNYVRSYDSGTETEADGATEWTVEFTPAASNNLYGCLYTNSECAATDAYIGGIKVVDKNGKDVAIDLSEVTDFYNNANITNSNFYNLTSDTPATKYYETAEVITISEITNANAKKILKYVLLGIEEQEPPAILKYSVGSTNQSYMVYKKVSASKLVPGTRYKLSIKYSGINFGKSDYIIVRDDVAKDTPSVLESRTSTSGEFLEHANYMEYVDYITVPDTPKDLYVGFYLRKSVWETANVYIGAITLTDINGNNAVTSLGDTTDLYGSFHGNTIKKWTDGPSNYVTLEKLPFDETMFPNDGISVPDYMLYAEHSKATDDSLVVEIPADKLVAGKEYVVEFSSNILTGEYNEAVCFGIFGGPGENGRTWSEALYGSALIGEDFTTSDAYEKQRKYTFTLTEKNFDKYYAGFYITGTDNTTKFYVSALTLYEADDKTKTNLIPNDGASMVNWHSNTETGTATGLGTASFVMYEKGNLALKDANFKEKTMLSFNRNTTKTNTFKVPVRTSELVPGVEYVVSLKYKNLDSEEEGLTAGMRIYADEGYTCDEKGNPTNPLAQKPGNNVIASTSGTGTNIKDYYADISNRYFVTNFTENQLATYKNIYVGFYLNGITHAYITDLVMYRKDDPNKVNLLIKDNYSTDLLGCAQDTRTALQKEADNFFGTTYEKYDASYFAKEYNITGSYEKGDRIAYKLDKSELVAGRSYQISLDYNFGTGLTLDKEVSMTVFGDSDNTDKIYADTVIVDKFADVESGKSDRIYNFTVTQEMLDKYDDIYVGFNFNKKVENVDIHFANFTVKDNTTGLAIYTQDRYSSKVLGWHTATERLGTAQVSHNFKTALLYGVQYPKYIFTEIDNGEWWNAEDIVPEEKNYDNTVKGVVIGVDGKPVKNAKIQLISGTNTYDVVTDSKGAFILNNIVPGYYQLYWIDKDGNLIPFDYGIDVAKGTLTTLNVKVNNVYDTTVDESVENAGDLGTIRGTVYTPQLKVVKGLKIYLGNLGYVVTDENGYFEFTNAPVGEYKLYTILENGKEYVFKTVQIKKDVEISTKLKYDPQIDADADASQNNIVLIIVLIAAIVILLGAGVTIILIAAKNKKKQ